MSRRGARRWMVERRGDQAGSASGARIVTASVHVRVAGCVVVAAASRLEVVPTLVAGDRLAELRAFEVGGAEVDARPDAGVRDLAQRIGEPREVAGGAGLVAVQGQRYAVA